MGRSTSAPYTDGFPIHRHLCGYSDETREKLTADLKRDEQYRAGQQEMVDRYRKEQACLISA